MKLSAFAAAALATAVVSSPAAASTTFIFDGIQGSGGQSVDAPTNGGAGLNNVGGDVNVCNSNAGEPGAGSTVLTDICTNLGGFFNYSKDGFSLDASARSGIAGTGLAAAATTPNATDAANSVLIQDLISTNQGLGVVTPGENTVRNDQINIVLAEAVDIVFDREVILSDIFVNDGASNDCGLTPGGEDGCGGVGILVDRTSFFQTDTFLAGGILDTVLRGTEFTFYTFNPGGLTGNFGYSIERFTVSAIPVPGALPLLISGIAGLGFASRRKRAT
ncbi:MAG: VPLPA-CTERM sorting domain-containing protein [Pseudomonadota bacterium]